MTDRLVTPYYSDRRLVRARESRLRFAEVVFWCLIIPSALVPSTQTPLIKIATVPMTAKEFALVIAGLMLMARLFFSSLSSTLRNLQHSHVSSSFLFLITYATLSLFWSGLDRDSISAMGFTLIASASAFIIGFSVIVGRSADDVRRFLWPVAIFLTAICALYIAQSFFALGFRASTAGASSDYGIERVRGPLFGSSTGAFILLPLLGFTLGELFSRSRNRLLSIVMVITLAAGMLALGSRAGVIALLAFTVMSVIIVPGGRTKLGFVFAVLIVGLVSFVFVFSRATPGRLLHFEDEMRETTNSSAWAMVSDRSVAQTLRGSGYGSVWNWYLTEKDMPYSKLSGRYYILTDYGYMLYHPHSIPLLLGVELGAIGMSFIIVLIVTIGQLLRRTRHVARNGIFACSIAATTTMLPTDLYLFKNYMVSMLWWLFLLAIITLSSSDIVRPITFRKKI